MRLSEEGPFEFNGTTLHLRLWEGENGVEKPVLVAEEGRGTPLAANRRELAEDIARSLGSTPDQISWYELSSDGGLKEYTFQPLQYEHRPYANDMQREDLEAAEKKGLLKPEAHTHYVVSSKDVAPNERKALEEHLNDKVESYEQRQNREFSELTFSRR